MSFISVFDVLGPNMIGPSSSHTAGAAVIAYLAHKMIAPPLKKVDFTLYGSFAKTYHGHGTDRALLGGIMGFSADDTRIRDSFAIATERGLAYSFTPNETETDDAGKTTSEAEELTTRISLIEHDLPFIHATRGHPARFAVRKDTASSGRRPPYLRFLTGY